MVESEQNSLRVDFFFFQKTFPKWFLSFRKSKSKCWKNASLNFWCKHFLGNYIINEAHIKSKSEPIFRQIGNVPLFFQKASIGAVKKTDSISSDISRQDSLPKAASKRSSISIEDQDKSRRDSLVKAPKRASIASTSDKDLSKDINELNNAKNASLSVASLTSSDFIPYGEEQRRYYAEQGKNLKNKTQ